MSCGNYRPNCGIQLGSSGACPAWRGPFILGFSRRGTSGIVGSLQLQPPVTQFQDDFDPIAVQREAAMFYGLFLRGHCPEQLRRDIEIPKSTFEKWLSHPHYDGAFRENVKRIYYFRRQVLAVFDELVDTERMKARLQ